MNKFAASIKHGLFWLSQRGPSKFSSRFVKWLLILAGIVFSVGLYACKGNLGDVIHSEYLNSWLIAVVILAFVGAKAKNPNEEIATAAYVAWAAAVKKAL